MSYLILWFYGLFRPSALTAPSYQMADELAIIAIAGAHIGIRKWNGDKGDLPRPIDWEVSYAGY